VPLVDSIGFAAWHFLRSIVFIDIAGCTFIFGAEARSQELEVRILSTF
jgi:hypothetical protein